MLTLMNRQILPQSAIDAGVLYRSKSRKILDDINQTKYMTTEARCASGHLVTNYYKDDETRIKAAELPNFRR